MAKFNKGDKVKIVNTGDIWEDREGTVVAESEEELITTDGQDLTEVTVKVKFNSDGDEKTVVQRFPRSNLEKESVAEALNEAFSREDFEKFFIGKRCRFQGLDYEDLYNQKEIENAANYHDDEELDDIEHFMALEGKSGVIVSCDAAADYDPDASAYTNFNNSYWSVQFDDEEYVESNLPGTSLIIEEATQEALTEEFDERNEQVLPDDYIYDYVHLVDINDKEIDSWFFADKIAVAENVTTEAVIAKAKELGYQLYIVEAPRFHKVAVAAKNCKVKDIEDDYADYLQGDVSILPLH